MIQHLEDIVEVPVRRRMVVAQNKGIPIHIQYTIILLMSTSKRVPLILGNPHLGGLILRPPTSLQPLRVQVPNNRILTQNLYYNYYYPNPKYLIIGYLDPLGILNPKLP